MTDPSYDQQIYDILVQGRDDLERVNNEQRPKLKAKLELIFSTSPEMVEQHLAMYDYDFIKVKENLNVRIAAQHAKLNP